MCSARKSKRKLKEMGNVELYELSETVRNSKEGTIYCGCGKCLIPSQEQTDKVKSRIDILADPLYVIKRGKAGERHPWTIIGKASDAARKCRKNNMSLLREKVDRRSRLPKHSTNTWMDSRNLHVPGLPQDDQDQLQGYSRTTRSIQNSIFIEMERPKESGKYVNSRRF